MATSKVRFLFGSLEKFNLLETKDPMALYFITDESNGTVYLYKGDKLYASDELASSIANGLMSSEDKVNLDELVANAITELKPVDGSMIINGNQIKVALSSDVKNALTLKDDGLYVDKSINIEDIPSYEIERQLDESDFQAVYKLKKTIGSESVYVGDAINIPKDLVISSGSLETVKEDNVPYVDAKVGDYYLDIVLNSPDSDHIYIPVNGLVDVYNAGDGLQLVDGTFSVNLGSETNGLHFVDGALNLGLATEEQAGAMSATDKVALDKLVALDIPTTYGESYEIFSKPIGTLVDCSDKEIRIMCPAGTQWALQQVGQGGDPSRYYVGFKAYAPSSDVTSFKESLAKTMTDQTMYYFVDNEFAGIDSNGRKYSIVWLPVAKHNDDGTWTYYGERSSSDKMIGWDYCVEWYNKDGVCVNSDLIRINITNESIHNSIEPYYMSGYVTDAELENTVNAINDSITWGEL